MSRSAWSWHRFSRNALIIGPIIGLTVWFVVKGVVPNVFPKNFGVVEQGVVYRSGELTPAALASVIERHNVRTVIDFGAHDYHPADERREQGVVESLGVRRVVLPLRGDARGNPNRYVDALRVMTDPEAQPVLVHCAAGSQRTGCAIALYRSIIQGWDDERALSETGEYGHDPEKNPNLRPMFERHRDDIERALRDGGVIEFDPNDFMYEPAPGDESLERTPVDPRPIDLGPVGDPGNGG